MATYPDTAIGMNDHIVHTGKLSPVIGGYERLGCIRWHCFHEYQTTRFRLGALVAEQDAGLVIDAAISHSNMSLKFFILPCRIG